MGAFNDKTQWVRGLSPERLQRLVDRIQSKRRDDRQRIGRQVQGAGPLILSFGQERLWFLDRFEPGNAAYNIPVGVELRGRLEMPALAAALGEVVRRHESLRTRFEVIDGLPAQRIEAALEIGLPMIDLRALPEPVRREESVRQTARHDRLPFDLERGPLLRVSLVRLAPDHHLFLLVLHHIVADGWSVGVLVGELAATYKAFVAGRPSPLLELPIQYADFALWQRHVVAGLQDREIAYWLERLAGEIAPLGLPTDCPRPAVQAYRGGRLQRPLGAELSQCVRALGSAEGATPFMTLLTIFTLLLQRLSGQDDVLVGTPVAGRRRVETEDLIGFFLNTLVLRVDVAGDPGFRELLARVRDVTVGAFSHQDVPFEALLARLRQERDPSRTALFQAMFNMLNFPHSEVRLPDLTLEVVSPPEVLSKFDLTLYVADDAHGFVLDLVYNASLFSAARMEGLLEQLSCLITQAVEKPERRIGEFSLVTTGARAVLPDLGEELAAAWEGSVCERLSRHARRAPSSVALSDAHGCWTYAELDAASDRVCSDLLAEGIAAEDRVAIYAHRSASLVAAVLGTLKAGAAFLILDPAYPAARLLACLRSARPRGWIEIAAAGPLPSELADHLAAMPLCRLSLPSAPLPRQIGGGGGVVAEPDRLAYLAFTSGSTGEPKAIAGSHRPLSHFCDWHTRRFGLGPEDRFSAFSGLSHDPLLRDLFAPLWVGATLCLPAPGLLTDAEALARWLREERITVAHLTPALAQLLAGAVESAGGRRLAPAEDLRYAFFGGDRLSLRDVRQLRRMAPWVACVSYYGATETPQAMGWAAIEPAAPGPESVPLGRGIPGVQLLVLDRRRGLAGIGELGEIAIRTPCLARGYLDPAATAEKFVPDPGASVGGRLYRTGDLGRYLPGGEIAFAGRADRQAKVRGFRVEPGEVEAALLALPGVREAAVLALERGGEDRLVAYVVTGGAREVTAGGLRDGLRRSLPAYLVPSELVILEEIPLTPNGKVDRRALAAAAPSPEPSRDDGPRTETEALVVHLMEGLLETAGLGAHDSFFDRGGHSLLGARLVSRLRDELGIDLQLGVLFEAPTAAGLAARIEDLRRMGLGTTVPPLTPMPKQGDPPLSFSQLRVWILDQLGLAGAYRLSLSVRMVGPLHGSALRSALDEVVRRHESLRTTFASRQGQPVQIVAPASALPLPLADLSAMPEALRAGEAARLATEFANRPFDLEHGPLARALLVATGTETHSLVLALHHTVADGWSMGVLVRELATLYESCGRDLPSPLPPLPVQYPDFAVWQRRCLADGGLDGQLSYWRERLAGMPPTLELLGDHPRRAGGSAPARRQRLAFGEDLSAALRAASRQAGVTPFIALLAGFMSLLYRHTGQRDFAVGTPIANRSRRELEDLIGFFAGTLVLRSDLTVDPALRELLGQTRRGLLAAFAHQDVPFERLVEELQPRRDLAVNPLFQVMFQFQNLPLPRVELPGLSLVAEEVPHGAAAFDLTLVLREAGGRFAGWFEYNADLWEATSIDRLAGRFERLLATALAEPERRLADLPLLSAAERHQVEIEWADRRTAVPGARVHELIELQVERTPDAIAVVCGGEWLTYRELDARAGRLARSLASSGVGLESRVGLCLGRGPAMIVALLAVWKAGGAYVPLDPSYPEERLAYILENAGLALLLIDEETPPTLLERIPTLRADGGSGEPDGAPPRVPGSPESLAYILYTSGSTGRPKGVAVAHGALVNFLASMRERPGLDAGDLLLAVTSLSFDISGLELCLPLIVGGSLDMAERQVVADGTRLRSRLQESGATVLQATPSTWRMLIEAGWQGENRLKVLCGGEALPEKLAAELRERSDSVWNLYGPTETTVWSTVARVEKAGATIGRPIANTRVALLDRLAPVPAGTPGELHIGGAGLARCYFGRPDLTAERFVPSPYAAVEGEGGARLYRTGDLARYLPDGTIEYLGRLDHQVKVRGFRIEPREVELALETHPAVARAVVVAREDRLVAYLIAREGRSEVPAAELRGFLKATLPEYMVPSAVVWPAALPLTPNGKVDRQALARLQPEVKAGDALHATQMERQIAGVWCEVLGSERVGVEDNFFDAGGHSLLLVRLHSRLQDLFGRELRLVDLFSHPTVRSQAELLGGDIAPSVPAEAARRAEGIRRMRSEEATRIAIVGMAGRFPGARDIEEFWQNLRAGVDAISTFTDEELQASGVEPSLVSDPRYVRAGGVLEDESEFDAAFFDYSPREAALIDPQHRVFLECAWQALESAGYDPGRFAGAIGVFAGTAFSSYFIRNLYPNQKLLASVGRQAVLGISQDYLTTRVSYKLGLKGPSFNVQTACSTALVAVHLACQSLLSGECDMALAGAVSIKTPQKTGYLSQEGGIDSPSGRCRSFDSRADGAVWGNGVGVVVLKRLQDALPAGDTIRAVILGSAINNDGSGRVGFTAPSLDGQAEVIATAQALAGVEPETIGYVECHGSATALGDPIEVAALARAFGPTLKKGFCPIGSVKANVGHLNAAAGAAGLIKAVLALERREIPPGLHFEKPNPGIDFASGPFYVNTCLAEWRGEGTPRRAGVSSFGLGGTNAHLVLEEAPEAPAAVAARRLQLLVFSAKSQVALQAATQGLSSWLDRNPGVNLVDVAYTLQVGRKLFPYRQALVCESVAEAREALAERASRSPAAVCESRPSVAFLLPGLGDHYPGMAQGLYRDEPRFQADFDHCAGLFEARLGIDLRRAVFAGGREEERGGGIDLRRMVGRAQWTGGELARTLWAQPAVFAVGYALARLWISWGVQPQALLGYSLGEYLAACLAGVFSLEDAVLLVAERARRIEELPAGSMMAVPLPEEETRELLTGDLFLAATNGPNLSVVAGPPEAVAALARRLADEGLPCRDLPTTHAFHSPMMRPAALDLEKALRRVQLSPPRIPYVSNVTGTWIRPAEAMDPDYWVRHLCGRVWFSEGLRTLMQDPSRVLLEVGAGQSLSALALQQGEQGKSLALPSLPHAQERQPDQRFLLESLRRLWLAGVEIDWQGIHGGERRRRLPLPTYPFERQSFWIPSAPAASRPAHGPGKRPDIADWFYAPSWKRIVRPALDSKEKPEGAWLIFVDELGVGWHLAEQLEARGCNVFTVSIGEKFEKMGERSFRVDSRNGNDYQVLLEQMLEMPRKIVHLLSLSPNHGEASCERFHEAQDKGFYSLIHLAQALGSRKRSETIEICIVANGLSAVERDDRIDPEKATLRGPALVIPQEYPRISCRTIDVDLRESAGDLVERLLPDLVSAGGEPWVAWRGPYCWVPSLEPLRLDAGEGRAVRLREGGAYLITGGLGGIGLALARHLALTAGARIALLGRSGIPARSEWGRHTAAGGELERRIRAVQDLESSGAEVLVLAVDVVDQDQMRGAVEQIRQRFGRIDGAFHLAGVPGNGLIQLKGVEQAAAVLAPKGLGTLALAAALADEPLDFLVLFSSINAVSGGLGQVDYCAANAFLDAFAEHQQMRGRTTLAIDWCPWQWDSWTEAVVVDPGIRSKLQRRRQAYGLTFEEGMEALHRILVSNLTRAIVSTADLLPSGRSGPSLPNMFDELSTPHDPAGHPRPITAAPFVGPRDEIELRLAALWQELLGVERISVHDNFFQLGGHSLLGLQFFARVRESFQVELSLPLLFDAPTIAQLAAAIGRRREDPTADELPEIRSAEVNAQRLLASVHQLSDLEVDDLLLRMMHEQGGGPS